MDYEVLYQLDEVMRDMYSIAPLFMWGGLAIGIIGIFKLITKKKGSVLLIVGILLFILGFGIMEFVTM